MKLIQLVKICLTSTGSKVHMGKHLSDNFPVRNGLMRGGSLSPALFNFALVCH
jgi:hypothetical protein